MKLRLMALPWHDFKLPQPALGALGAYLRQHEPSWDLATEYAYLDIAEQGPEVYDAVAATQFEGERVYATMMYPQGIDKLIECWERLTPVTQLGAYLAKVRARGQSPRDVLAALHRVLFRQLDELAARDWSDTIVGLTTSFSQLFANLMLARRIKDRGANAIIVLGGSTVSPAAIADSVLATYPAVDYIVRGEGELPLRALVRYLLEGGTGPLPRGVVSRDAPAATGSMWQVEDLDALPIPDYDAFYDRAGPTRGRMVVPLEGSRGCWWDRTTKNPKSTCQFCNLNVQWDGYRQRSAASISATMRALADRYRCTHFQFLDNIVRTRGFDELMTELGALDLDARIFHEARANLRPPDIQRFHQVGMRAVQFGLEGLSTSFLKRINKGTTAIMNLEVMKTCAELGIHSASNLIIDFPGSTQAEVDETVEMIDRYAYAYEPPAIASFELGIDSAVMRFPDDFGIRNVRNHHLYADVIPPAQLATLVTFQMSFDLDAPAVSWDPVYERVERWKRDYKPHPVWYQDGGNFLHVHRTRPGQRMETVELLGEDAHLYRYCMQIRTRGEIHEAFAGGSADHAAELDARLQRMVERDIVFQEGAKFLALATAADAAIATRRIEAARRASPIPRAPRRLAVVR